MRPIYLKLKAFGSYGEEQVVDFTKPTQNLFLITGDTGAGKTTIFDAMVFALYGEASSNANKKSGMILQSQFAPEDEVPRVEFQFEEIENGEPVTYTIIRSPEYLRRTKRKTKNGATHKKESAKAELILPDGTIYNKEKSPNNKIIDIVGLNKSQFMQVAMIAQGEFMELLRASSDEKKEIFRKLFHTELYNKMVEILQTKKKEKERDLGVIKTRIQEIAVNVRLPEDYPEVEAYEEYYKQIQDGTMAILPEYVEILSDLCRYCGKALKEIDDRWKENHHLLEEKKKEYISLSSWWEIYAQYQKNKKTYEACLSKEEEMKQLHSWLENTKKAKEIYPYEKAYKDAVASCEKYQKDIADYEASYPETEKGWKEASEQLMAYKPVYEEEHKLFIDRQKEVEEARSLFEKISEQYRQLAVQQKAMDACKKSRDEKEQALNKTKEKKTAARTLQLQYKDAEMRYALYKEEGNKYNEKQQKWVDLKKVMADCENLKKEISDQRTAFLQLEKEREQLFKIYDDAEKCFLREQVGILADQLEEGQPCPVCGSLHHPEPACKTQEENIPSQQDVEEKRDAWTRKKEEAYNLSTDIKVMMENLKQKQETIQIDTEELCSFFDVDQADQLEAGMLTYKASLKEKGTKLVAEVKTYRQAVEEEENYTKEEKTCQEAFENARDEYTQAEKLYFAGKQLLEDLQLKKKYASSEEIDQLLQEAEVRWNRHKTRYEEFISQEKERKTEKERQATLLKQWKETLPGELERCDRRKKEYEEAYGTRGFSSKDQWRAYYDQLDEELLDENTALYETFTETRSASKNHMESNEKLLHLEEGMKPPLEETAEEKKKLQDQEEAMDPIKEDLKSMTRRNKEALERLQSGREKRERFIEEYNNINNLYTKIAGRTSGENKMDLETYVQRYYLEQILVKANRRFEKLSAGQFRLALKDIKEAGKGKNEGLDLMVDSLVTGKRREIRSLSGGESFMAALSLALGMADQIQEQSSALQLDMMFIDEGFGSLDETSRNQAIRVLKEMAGGNKLIGIISHVGELKQELDNQLVITKDDRGSHCKWSIS